MNERKILLFILSVIAYCMYSVHMWFMKDNGEPHSAEVPLPTKEIPPEVFADNNVGKIKKNVKTKVIPLFLKDGCSILQIFTEKLPVVRRKDKKSEMDANNNALSMFGIAVFLVILTVNAVLDVIKVKEEERVRRQLNPNEERRQSLAEFANKKTLRRESSKFGQQLFQIAEAFVSKDEEPTPPPRRQTKPYTRGDSTNSYLSENMRKNQTEGSAPASISETSSGEPRLVKRQSVAKLIGLSDD